MSLKPSKYLWLIVLVYCNFTLAQDRPNILWLTFEDTSPQFIGCYGDPYAETPVMDKMAENGIRYINAFSTNTVCSPSRTSIITGVPTYQLGTGNHRSNYAIPDNIKGFPYYLKNSGYYVTNNYKTDYNVQDEQAFIEEAWDDSSGQAGWWNRNENQPFFSVFNIADSHQSRTMSMPYEWYVKNVLDYLPENPKRLDKRLDNPRQPLQELDSENSLVSEFADLHVKHHIADTAFRMPPIFNNSAEMRKQMARVYNSIKLTDLKMGRILDRLRQDNLMENTIIFIFADHGEGLPRMKTNGIAAGYKVPFIVWFPPKYKHLAPNGKTGVVNEELISFEDLAPTILGLTSTSKPDHLNGRRFLGKEKENAPEYLYLASDRADNGIDLVRSITDGKFMYSRNFMPFYPELRYIRYIEQAEITRQMREDYQLGRLDSIQTKMFKSRPPEVLYDIQDDIWEINNLNESNTYQDKLLEFRALLHQNIKESIDVNFMPEYTLQQLSQNDTPFNKKHDYNYYPIDEILTIATEVGYDDLSSIESKLEALNHSNQFVRYWASLGLYGNRAILTKAQIKKVQSALVETYQPAKITLAATLLDNVEDDKVLTILTNSISSDKPELTLTTINYLLYAKKKSLFKNEVEEILDKKQVPYKVQAVCIDFLNLL